MFMRLFKVRSRGRTDFSALAGWPPHAPHNPHDPCHWPVRLAAVVTALQCTRCQDRRTSALCLHRWAPPGQRQNWPLTRLVMDIKVWCIALTDLAVGSKMDFLGEFLVGLLGGACRPCFARCPLANPPARSDSLGRHHGHGVAGWRERQHGRFAGR